MHNDNLFQHPYSQFKDEEFILRDWLAIDRTVLANERTLLSYVRTGIAFLVTAAGLFKFFDSTLSLVTGYLSIGIAVVTVVFGIVRFVKINHHLQQLKM